MMKRTACMLMAGTALLLPGCVQHELGYDMRRIMVQDGEPLNASVTVKPFLDRRREYAPEALFGDKHKLEQRDHTLCINAEGNYLGKVPERLAKVIDEHLTRRGVFRPKNDAATQYVLEGTLVALYGGQGRSHGAFHAQQAGGVGAGTAQVAGSLGKISAHSAAVLSWTALPLGILAGAAFGDTPGSIEIAFTDLQLRRASDGVVQPLSPVALRFTGNLPETGHCESIYGYVNQKLKIAVEKLTVEIESAARTFAADRQPATHSSVGAKELGTR